MPEQNDLNSADLEFEQALRSIPPTPAHLNPTAAAFLAGQRSARTRLHLWQSASAALLLLGIGSHILPQQALHPIPPPAAQTAPPMLALSPHPFSNRSALMLQYAVQKNGLAGLSHTHLPDFPARHSTDNF